MGLHALPSGRRPSACSAPRSPPWGWLADKAGAGAQNPAGYAVMLWFFFLLSLVALASAILLWRRETGPKGHGLEEAREPRRNLRAIAAG